MIEWLRGLYEYDPKILVPIVVFGLAFVAWVCSAIFGGRCPKCRRFKQMTTNGESDWRKGWFRSVEYHQWECLSCGHTYWRKKAPPGGGGYYG